jgi:hypothetical protein
LSTSFSQEAVFRYFYDFSKIGVLETAIRGELFHLFRIVRIGGFLRRLSIMARMSTGISFGRANAP